MTLHSYWRGFAPIGNSLHGGTFGIEVRGFRIGPLFLRTLGTIELVGVHMVTAFKRQRDQEV